MKRVICCLVVLFSATDWTDAATFYVSPMGNDLWSGKISRANTPRTDGPLASLTGARDKIRKLKETGPLTEPVRVLVEGGSYTLTEPFTLTTQDSGTKDCPVTYEAGSRADAVFSGGRRVVGFNPGFDGLWSVHIPQVASGKLYFEQLWVNGRRAVRATTPNKFYHYMQNVSEKKLEDGQGRAGAEMRQTVTIAKEDIQPLLKLDKTELNDVAIRIYHKWDNTTRFIDAVDADANTIITDGKQMKSWNPWVKNTPYILENFKRALDSPGDW
jgi:hypothetical protein